MMDQSFNRATLARCLLKKDFYVDKNLNDKSYRRGIVDQAVSLAQASEVFFPVLSVNNSSNKPIYSVQALPEKLVLRKCAKNIKAAGKIYLKPRGQIIKEIRHYLREGTPYTIYRLDIASFYENCDYENILANFSKHQISTQTQVLLNSFLSEFNKKYSSGIPRGVESSPILSELYLVDMDARILASKEVLYYSRFADDIFIITSSQENKREFLKTIRNFIPNGLFLNHNKTEIFNVARRSCGSPQPIASIDYLGYKISVVDNDLSLINPLRPAPLKTVEYREVLIDLTVKKTNRIKEKISKSFYAFAKDLNYELLKDRLVFLSTNRDLLNKVKNRKIPTGVYYSHSEIDFPSYSLENIDKFLKILINKPQGRISSVLVGKLTKQQKKDLLKISFSDGFKKRTFKRYSPDRLSNIARIW